MINRTKINNSLYDILDEDPSKIKQYIEAESKKTAKQKEKEKKKRNKVSNISDINLKENLNNQEKNPSNQIVIHTEKDNLTHNYFHSFMLYWDAGDALSNVIIKMPKTDTENTKYWITYDGEVTIYFGNDINREWEQKTNENNQSQTNESYWDIQNMQAIFRGEIGNIKEYQETLEIHIDSIGKRFKQKIPDDFRQSFINNQNVRDAFQAICEFIGVKYICPPPNPKEQDEEMPNESAQNDGTQNNVDGKTNQEKQLASEAANRVNNAVGNASQNNGSNGSNNQTSNNQLQNGNAQNSLDGTDQQNDIQNGYSDISFDANGSIVHGSVAIETSPDMEDTLLALEDHPLDKYLEDTTYVATDVKKFLNGEMFETVHGFAMNYGSITIEPKSSSTSDMSTISGTNGTNSSDSNKNGWHDGQLYENGKIVLYDSYINTLSPEQAKAKAEGGANTYTKDTLDKLWRRANG